MKLSRDSLSGAIHGSGIGATFCVRWLVVAKSSADAQAASEIHKRMVVHFGRGAASSATVDCTGSASVRLFHAATRQTPANRPNAIDQMTASSASPSLGPTTWG